MRERTTKQQLLALTAGLLLVGAACGDDDGGGGAAGSGSVEAWCDALGLSDEGDQLFESLATASPDELRSGLARTADIVDDLQAASPPEIADDVTYLGEYIDQFDGVLADADYSVFDADLSVLDVDRLDAMQRNLDEFSQRECGRPFGEDDTSGGDTGAVDDGEEPAFDPSSGTIRDQLVNQFVAIGLSQEEAECLADNVDQTDESVLSGDQDAILGLFDACDIPLSRLAELGG